MADKKKGKRSIIKPVFFLVFAYICIYFAISRVAQYHTKQHGVDGFIYFPLPTENYPPATVAACNQVGFFLFYPIYLVDNRYLGGPSWVEPVWGAAPPRKHA
jgi:hypothetical protein